MIKNEKEIHEKKARITRHEYEDLHNETERILYLIEKREMELNLAKEKLHALGAGGN